MVTFADEDAQGGLEVVHLKTFGPTPKPVIVVLFKVGVVIVPLPETKVHKPVPIAGLFPAIVATPLVQTFCAAPAFAAVGAALVVIVI